MGTPPYKVAYIKGGNVNTLYSRFFNTQVEARAFLQNVKEKGDMGFLMVAKRQPTGQDEVQMYEWELLPSSDNWKLKAGAFATSLQFLVPLGIAVIAFVLLRKGNGLPRIVA